MQDNMEATKPPSDLLGDIRFGVEDKSDVVSEETIEGAAGIVGDGVKSRQGAMTEEFKRDNAKENRRAKRAVFFVKLKRLLTLGFYGSSFVKVFRNLDVLLNVFMIIALVVFIVYGAFCLVTERYIGAVISAIFVMIMKSVASSTTQS